jgi:hypothetical protein
MKELLTLVVTFVAFVAGCILLLGWWHTTWQLTVEPVRAEVYRARTSPSPCFYGHWWWWRSAGCQLL